MVGFVVGVGAGVLGVDNPTKFVIESNIDII